MGRLVQKIKCFIEGHSYTGFTYCKKDKNLTAKCSDCNKISVEYFKD